MPKFTSTLTYDPSNIFAQILRGDLPADTIYEDDLVMAFKDINPQAPTHVVVVPKGAYVDFTDFSTNASDEEVTAYFRVLGQLSHKLNLHDQGFRVISNQGSHGGQEVGHFHTHLVGGQPLGAMINLH